MSKIRCGIFYKNFAAWKGVSHIGLGVAAMNNAEYLNARDIETTVFPVRHNVDIVGAIKGYAKETGRSLTHVVVSAPWLSTRDMRAIVEHFPTTQFVVVSHSNVGFLQADPQGIRLIQDYLELTRKLDNISVGGNCDRFTRWLSEAYGEHAVLLPNLYPTHEERIKDVYNGRGFRDVVKIGSFGAVRPLKNQLTACAAAIVISRRIGLPTEFHINAGREEGGGGIVVNAIKQMAEDVPNFKIMQDGWRGWHEFRATVADMDLLIHPSYTESFNMVTGDGITQGVPVVGSPAINWLPAEWKADSDDAVEIARIGMKILGNGVLEGILALKRHNRSGFESWKKFLAS